MVSEAFPSPGYVRILQSIYPDDVRGKMMSLVRMGRILSMVAVAPLAGWALDRWGYQALFPVGHADGDAVGLLFARLEVNEPPLAPRRRTLSELRQILREDKRFSYFLTAFSVYGTGTLMSWTLYPLVQVDRLGLSYSDLGWLGLVQSLFWFLSYAFWGRIVDRAGGVAVLRGNAHGGALFAADLRQRPFVLDADSGLCGAGRHLGGGGIWG
ncbi:MAG: MFS transporter [Caldilineaceae bacterium]